jgi:hypothetical protein
MSSYRDKLASIGFLPRGRTRDKVREFRRPDGVRVKETRGEHGHSTYEHNTKDDRVDVTIRAPEIRIKASVEEAR